MEQIFKLERISQARHENVEGHLSRDLNFRVYMSSVSEMMLPSRSKHWCISLSSILIEMLAINTTVPIWEQEGKSAYSQKIWLSFPSFSCVIDKKIIIKGFIYSRLWAYYTNREFHGNHVISNPEWMWCQYCHLPCLCLVTAPQEAALRALSNASAQLLGPDAITSLEALGRSTWKAALNLPLGTP